MSTNEELLAADLVGFVQEIVARHIRAYWVVDDDQEFPEPDGYLAMSTEIVQRIHARLSTQRAVEGVVVTALEPFATFAEALGDHTPDNIAIGIYAGGCMSFGPSGGANVGDLRRARAALSCLSTPEQAKEKGEGWQPIETAPKDGTKFLVWLSDDEWPAVVCWRAYDPNDAEEPGEPGYWDYAENLLSEVLAPPEPTHWMPLPAPEAER